MTLRETMAAITSKYEARKAGKDRPGGTSGKGNKWYPSEAEHCACCDYVRPPSRAYPWSYYKHCFTRKHIQQLIHKEA